MAAANVRAAPTHIATWTPVATTAIAIVPAAGRRPAEGSEARALPVSVPVSLALLLDD